METAGTGASDRPARGVRLTRELTPDDVGRRVMVRRVLAEGGYGDVLGELVRWSGQRLVLRTGTGSEVVVDEADMVAGKRIPPPPRRRTTPPGRG